MKIKTLLMAMLMALPMLLTSCSDDSNLDPTTPEWWGGKKFTALMTDENHDYLYYVLEFKYSPDGKTNDGSFSVTPYTLEGKKLNSFKTYTGVWSLNYNSGRISVVYTGASMNYNWTFYDYEGTEWPNYNPNRRVFGAMTASDPFGNVTFFPGLTWKDPNN